jgi:rhodanese-related sulfurtransferase
MAKQSNDKISKKMQRRAEARRKKQQQILMIGGVVLVLIAAVIGFMLWGGGSDNQPATAGSLPLEVDVQQAHQMVEEGAFLLDVRTQEEWDDYHAPQATLIPLDELPNRLDEVPRDRDIVVICNSGNRSQVGRDILLDAGFERVTSSAGGMKAWASAGYPTE